VLTPLTFTLWPVISMLFKIDYEAYGASGLAGLAGRSQPLVDDIGRLHGYLRDLERGMAIHLVTKSLINRKLKKNDTVKKKHHSQRTLNSTESSHKAIPAY
jgi:hypothetical protein